MKTGQVVLLLVGIAALAVIAWTLFQSDGEWIHILGPAPRWAIEASGPLLIGDLNDPFAYAGGEGVRRLAGEGTLRLYDADGSGDLRLSVALDGTVAVLSESIDPPNELELHGVLRSDATDDSGLTIHGETGRGDERLPETFAVLSGLADVEIVIDGTSRGSTLRGRWSVARALRREDGAIRNQGLIFSPLLRDDTVFADADRLELTLLLYRAGGGTEGQTDSVVLHLVYENVEILASPDAATPPE